MYKNEIFDKINQFKENTKNKLIELKRKAQKFNKKYLSF